ncbi:response regulator transcription factor [Nitrincola nitratireducens]|uniref:Transcriptional regulatory protein OmpR n=1 Tax=Nitrincola nitratireducens TaxID=1229521 RepID=W9UTQ8_9GAMM|nr:response regulator transcription factor [Nitrincola nitratireducens]EXJ10464.1 Transcriptional regulatory protein OmpR [Nitrincola nitratireducens]
MTDERLLLIDDDVALCELLSDYLKHEGYRVDAVYSVDQALQRLNEGPAYDLLILDVMMPGRTGLELLQELRPRVLTPVIMLTGRGQEIDKILGLEMGADDYMAKPCNPRELLARIRAVLRRSQYASAHQSQPEVVISLHGIELDAGRRCVLVQGEPIELTSAEFNVLYELMKQAGVVLSKELLTEKVLHRKLTAYDRALDVHVSRVRQKLALSLGSDVELIKTVRGHGYLFVKD